MTLLSSLEQHTFNTSRGTEALYTYTAEVLKNSQRFTEPRTGSGALELLCAMFATCTSFISARNRSKALTMYNY